MARAKQANSAQQDKRKYYLQIHQQQNQPQKQKARRKKRGGRGKQGSKQPLPQGSKQPLPQSVPQNSDKQINYEVLFERVKRLNHKVHGSRQRSKSKEPCVPYQGVPCNLCGITFFNAESLRDHRKDASHKELFFMSQAKEAAVHELLTAHAHLMVARDNFKQERGSSPKAISRCQVCTTLHRRKLDHNKTKYHLLLNDFQSRQCQQCKLPLRGIETFHRDSPLHLWGEVEEKMCNKVKHFDGLFNLDKNLQISIQNGEALIQKKCEVKFKQWKIHESEFTSDYDPSKRLGIDFVNSRVKNYCFVCKMSLPVTTSRKALTGCPQDVDIHAEKHCCSYEHYTNLAKFLQDHQDELLEEEGKEQTDHVNKEKTETASMEVIESAASVAKKKKEETQTASIEKIESATSVVNENKGETQIDSMEVIEPAASIANENEEETQTASMEGIEPVAVASKPSQVKTDGSDDASSAAVPTKEISVGSTQHEEVEERPRKVALIGDSWIQDFPVQSLPGKWNVSTYGWKEASAKAFLVREDVDSVVETNPSVAVLHLGANDICKKYSSESIVCDIMDIVRTLEDENIITHVCEIPLKTAPLKISAGDYDAVRQSVNRDLSLKLSKSTNFIRIPDLKDYLINGINLNSEGYAKFADVLEKVIDGKCSVNTTTQ